MTNLRIYGVSTALLASREKKILSAMHDAESSPTNELDHDDDVDRKRTFHGQLNRFLHQTDTAPILRQRRRVVTRLQSTTSTISTTATSTLPPPTTTTRKPKRKPKRSDSSPVQKHKHTISPPSRLRDTIPPNLILLLVGLNPGLLTGSTGYAYAHPSNLFWKLLYSSGITPIRHPPSDTYKLPDLYAIGNTNIVERPTRDGSMLSKAEMDAGVPILEAKVADKRPEVVALVGKGIWESVWRVRHGRAIRKDEFRYGWQDESENMGRCAGWETGARVFVATTTSGLAATMSLAEKQEVWNELGAWVRRRREDLASVICDE